MTAAPRSPRREAPVRPLEGFGAVFAWGLARGFSGPRFWGTVATTVGFGVLLGVLVSFRATDPVLRVWESLDAAVVAIGVPLVALALAGGGYAEEVAEQTLVYQLVRPVSRATVFVARFAAGLLPAAFAAPALVVAFVLASRTGTPAPTVAAAAAVAALGACTTGAVYYVLAALLRRGVVAGLVWTFVVEGLFQFLPGSIQNLSLMHHVRSVLHHATDADFAARSARVAARLAPPPRGLPGGLVERAPEEWSSVSGALLTCGVVAAAALAIGVLVVRRRDYALESG